MARIKGSTKLTSVKLLTGVYHNFKIIALQNGIRLQEVANRSIWLYANDREFRQKIDETVGMSSAR